MGNVPERVRSLVVYVRLDVFRSSVADSFFANGIVSGTNAIQALMENRSIEMLTEAQPNPVVQAETERLREDFANGLI